MEEKKKDAEKIQKKVALVHDFLLYPGGAESVLDELIAIFPDAPVYTLLYDPCKMGKRYEHVRIHTSFLQKLPQFLRRRHRYLLPLCGAAVESFDLRDFDVIISSSGAWSKGIVTRLDTKHIAYVHSPMRYVWDENEHYLSRIMQHRKRGFCIRAILSYLRIWDHQAAQRPDIMIANSQYTAQRIAKYYRRTADVLYPVVESPYDKKDLRPLHKKPYFVVISRLSEHKNVLLAVETCNKLQMDLVVIGDGPEYHHIKKSAGPHITMTGWVDEKKKWQYLAHARALLFPTEDDFGIVCAEALCMNVPVIALGRGGAKEIVKNGETGELFDAPTVEMMADGIRRFLEHEGHYEKDVMQETVRTFARVRFRDAIQQLIT